MAQYGNLYFKQQAVSPFTVSDKGSVTNVHKWLKYVYGINAIDKNTAVTVFHEFAGSKKDQAQLNDVRHSGWSTTAVTQHDD